MLAIDCHVHCGTQDVGAPQSYEAIAPLLDAAAAMAAVCFSPVAEIYDRSQPTFTDTPAWQARRRQSRDYLCGLRGRRHRIYPFHFVWNDFDASGLERFCGIKWHRHAGEPVYQYADPRCARLLAAIRAQGFVVTLDEEYVNTRRFLADLGAGIPVILPHLGKLNGGFHRLLAADVWRPPHVYADLSSALVTAAEVRLFLDRYGPEKLLFGSDYPFGSPARAKQLLLGLGLAAADLELILAGNLVRLLRNTDQYGGLP